LDEVFDRTTTRWEENSKVILIDGAHAIGKTDFAKQIADEFDMKLFAFPKVSDVFINYYGQDLNDYAVYLDPRLKPYDERDFSRNPTGPVEGSGDRFHWQVFKEKYRNYIYALKHLYNTGQGVVVEGDPWSDYAHFEAAYHQGWVERGTRIAYKTSHKWSMLHLLRPHVLIYLDAPVDVVMRNIKARGNPWDKDSPVWTNKRYLSDIYNEKKRRYLMRQQKHSHVLVYDWSTPGETDVVVDDIEKIDLDLTDEYDDLLRDWTKNRTEQMHSINRWKYCNQVQRSYTLHVPDSPEDTMEAEHLYFSPQEIDNMERVMSYIKGDRYAPGSNPAMGDKHVWAKCDFWFSAEHQPRYLEKRVAYTRPWFPFEEDAWLEPVKIQK